MTAFYNEIDPKAAAWLRELIKQGHIAPGVVDERSITEIQATDLMGFTQCHFFAGIGIWSYALRQSGVSDDQPLWTASLPCQPFSVAGRQRGTDDERHLFPVFDSLRSQCEPSLIFGEQVAGKGGIAWLDLVQDALETAGYSCGAAVTAACGFGAPNQRKRIYWVAENMADTSRNQWKRSCATTKSSGQSITAAGSQAGGMADTDSNGCHQERESQSTTRGNGPERNGATGIMDDTDSAITEQSAGKGSGSDQAQGTGSCSESDRSGDVGIMGDTDQPGLEGHNRHENREHRSERQETEPIGPIAETGSAGSELPGPTNGFWRNADWISCRDGVWRAVEPGTFPLANGPAGRVGLLRGYGNGLNAEQAIGFIESYFETIEQENQL